MIKMPSRITDTIELFQWLGILIIGLYTSIVPDYTEGLMRVFWTVMSMSLGTIASYYIKRLLNKRKKK